MHIKTINRLGSGIALAVTCVTALAASSEMAPYLDTSLPADVRARDALSRMTLDEKIAIIHAQSKFSSPGVARLGIPGLWTTDGPHGIRPDVLWDEWEQAGATNDSCVAFPSLTCLAATWNPEMAAIYGKSIGEEARYRDKDVLLGPGVNICRTPLNGRNFEYLGEDPLLAGRLAAEYVKGVQSNGVAACVKHFALNNQERERDAVDVIVDDRALYEIYLPAFKWAVKNGGAWSIMPGYNRVAGNFACENQRLLIDILKNAWEFDGAVISDWGAVHNTDKVAVSGLDMEFGSYTDGLSHGVSNAYDNYYLANPYKKKIMSGELGEKSLDEKALRVLTLIMRTSMHGNRPFGSMTSPEHYANARRIAGEGIVLLKNTGDILPVSKDIKKILVVGENAIKMMTVGGGSSSLKVQREITPLDGIRSRAEADGIEVTYSRGYIGDVSGEYNGVTTGQDLSDSRMPEEILTEAVSMAKEADMVIFIGGLNKSGHQDCEGTDRLDFSLPYSQDTIIESLASVNPRTVAVILSGNAYSMPWLDKIPAVIQAWYPGSESGNAIADILFGDVNPSGRLPFTFAKSLRDYASHASGDSISYPGENLRVEYREGIDVGYRHTDRLKRDRVNFPFGYGLSYTTFTLGTPTVSTTVYDGDKDIEVAVPVSNTGQREGKHVVQIYIHPHKAHIYRPLKELRGFDKIGISPGETVDAVVSLGREAFAYYDSTTKKWRADKGKYDILIGTSASDITGKITVRLTRDFSWDD